MSFLLQKNLSAHLHLHLMALSPLDSSPEAALQKLNLLARTRRFDLIAECAKSLSMPFPSLGASTLPATQSSRPRRSSRKSRRRSCSRARSSKGWSSWMKCRKRRTRTSRLSTKPTSRYSSWPRSFSRRAATPTALKCSCSSRSRSSSNSSGSRAPGRVSTAKSC